MKKLMIAAAAVIGATMAQAVESSIVGYQNIPVSENNVSMGIPTFSPVGAATTIDIQDIKVQGGGLFGGMIQIQTLTGGGATDETFFWIPEAEAGDYGMEGEGWWDMNTGVAAEKTFLEGEAYVLSNDYGDGATMLYNGEVLSGATAVPISENNVSISGNMTPSDFDIQAFVVDGESLFGGMIQIQTLTGGGATDETYFWIPEAEAGDYGMEGEGWWDMNTGVAAEKTFNAGEGFILSNDYGDGATLTIPSALE